MEGELTDIKRKYLTDMANRSTKSYTLINTFGQEFTAKIWNVIDLHGESVIRLSTRYDGAYNSVDIKKSTKTLSEWQTYVLRLLWNTIYN